MHHNPLIHLAYYHHYGHSYGTTGWITHMVISAVVHSLIYGAMFRVMRGMSLPEILLLAGVVIGGVYLWARQRDRRGW